MTWGDPRIEQCVGSDELLGKVRLSKVVSKRTTRPLCSEGVSEWLSLALHRGKGDGDCVGLDVVDSWWWLPVFRSWLQLQKVTVRRVDVGLGGVKKLVGSGASYPKVQ